MRLLIFVPVVCVLGLLAGCTGGGPSAVQREILDRAAEAEAAGRVADAIAAYRRLAEGGVSEAMLRLAALYEEGRGVEADPATAFAWYRRAAEAGHPRAMRQLGDRLRDGDGVAADAREAAMWYERAAAAGDLAATGRLGRLLLSGDPAFPSDPARGFALLEKAATAGDVDAQIALAEALAGEKLAGEKAMLPRPAEARRWYAIAHTSLERLVEEGDMRAAETLGRLYAEGRGVKPDGARAAELFHVAARGGRLEALVRLARLYRDGGPGLAADPVRAIAAFREAASRGHRTAAYELGRLLLERATSDGAAGPEAAGWLLEAAEAGESRAWFWLGELWGDPGTQPHDPVRAAEYWEKAGRAGEGKGFFRLGEAARERGELEEAVFWFELAGQSGYERGRELAARHAARLDAATRARLADRLKAFAGQGGKVLAVPAPGT